MKLINYQYLRNEVDISQNVPDDELDNAIKRSQEMLEMVIGASLYAELEAQMPTFTEANATLMDYVKKFLAWQAYQFWLVKANIKDTRAGLRVLTEDNSQPASDKQMAELIRDAKMWAQTKKEKLVTFLEDNYESYPLYDYRCKTNKRSGTGFHITSVGKHHKGCNCHKCHGHS